MTNTVNLPDARGAIDVTLTPDGSRDVVLSYTLPGLCSGDQDEAITHRYRAIGSYVYRIMSPDRVETRRQVCRGLALRGPALMPHDQPLADVIRREWTRPIRKRHAKRG